MPLELSPSQQQQSACQLMQARAAPWVLVAPSRNTQWEAVVQEPKKAAAQPNQLGAALEKPKAAAQPSKPKIRNIIHRKGLVFAGLF